MQAARVVLFTFLLAVIVGGGMVVLPTLAMAISGHQPTNCGRACFDPGVTENPYITLIGNQ